MTATRRRTAPGERVRVGVLGAGAWAEFAHLPGYVRDPRCELVAIADPIRSRAEAFANGVGDRQDRKSTRLNSSHSSISYAVFCLKKKKNVYLPISPLSKP